jgi:dTDP-4-dehydrorhamnose reductase
VTSDAPRWLLFGASGQVGSALAARIGEFADCEAPSRSEADFGDPESLRRLVHGVNPRVIINAAAFTAVDRAESEPDLARRVNALAPGVLAEAAARAGARLIHYSTDYVFDGAARLPYPESAPAAPLSVYGRTKLEGDRLVLAACPAATVLRTGWVYSPGGSNFLLTMRRLMRQQDEVRVVDDQYGAPTTAAFLARATLAVLHSSQAPGGVYHITAAGETTWCGFARAIHERLRARESLACRSVVPITTAQYPTPARRPAWSVLDCTRFERTFSFAREPWKQLLDEAVAALPLADYT